MPDGTSTPPDVVEKAEKRLPAQQEDLLSRAAPAEPAQAGLSALSDKTAVHDLVKRLQAEGAEIAKVDPGLSKSINDMAQDASRPGGMDKKFFATHLAFNLQEVEMLRGTIGTVPEALREELKHLTTNVPGLTNDRLKGLLAEVPDIDNAKDRWDIRRAALLTAKEGGDQVSTAVTSRIDALESRIRSNEPSRMPASMEQPGDPGYDPGAAGKGASVGPDRGELPQKGPATAPPQEKQAGGDPGRPADQKTSPDAEEKAAAKPLPQPDAIAPGGPATVTVRQDAPAAAASGQVAAGQAVQGGGGEGISYVSRLLGKAVASFTNDTLSEMKTFKAVADATIGDRLKKAEAIFETRGDDASIRAAEALGQAVLGALKTLENSTAAPALNQIKDAIKNNPGGAPEVFAEMAPGGRFADLREKFNVSMAQEKGAEAALDKVASSLEAYGVGREAVAALGAKRGTANALEARFEALDKEIGTAVSALPSKEDGKSLVDDLTEKLKAVLDRAVTAVKSAFNPSTEKTASGPSASP